MRVIEPWVAEPLQGFLDESGARLTLLMTSAGQVSRRTASPGRSTSWRRRRSGPRSWHRRMRSLSVMSTAAFGVVAAPGAKAEPGAARLLDAAGTVDRTGGIRVGNVGRAWCSSSFQELELALAKAAPAEPPTRAVLAENFEHELNASLRSLFGR